MKKIHYSVCCTVAFCTALLFSCASPPKMQDLVQSAVFEVLVKKPAEDPDIIYDKELDWSLVPYAVRTDDYYSIGTAFAISSTELVTAFHVINLGEESAVFKEYYIRDAQGDIFEVDTIVRASSERDALVFTVKDKTFGSYFQLETNFTVGSQVFSIGNALGEGIIVRNGLVLGTVPEEEEGRWNLLKSSADGNPGNSGGPLVTQDGKVIGVVTSLRDNILYSLPIAALLEIPEDTLQYRKKLTYTHLILANRLTRVFETQVSLPDTYKSIRTALTERFSREYIQVMKDLFAAAPVFLNSPNNMHLLNTVVNTTFPEIDFVDKNDDQWKMSNFDVKTYSLPDDGSLTQASISNFVFMKINKPKTASLTELNTDPKVLMDLILKGVNMERTLGSAGKYRILSYGSPASVSEYRDRIGRLWIKAYWLIGYEDAILMTYILPLPNGPAVIMTKLATADIRYDWDIDAICDHIEIAYRANFDEWNEFLTQSRFIPQFLSGFEFQWNADAKNISIRYPDVSFRAGPEVFDWTSASALFLAPAYYPRDGKIVYGICKAVIQRDIRGRDYAVLYKNVKPDARLGEKTAESWEDLVQKRYPFDGIPRISSRDNTGFAGVILPQTLPSADIRYSLYLAMENPQGEDIIKDRLTALENGISIEQ